MIIIRGKMKYLSILILLSLCSCGPRLRANKSITDGVYAFMYGKCGGIPSQITVTNGMADQPNTILFPGYNYVAIDCGAGRDIYGLF